MYMILDRFKNKWQYLMILGHFHILNFDHSDANLTFYSMTSLPATGDEMISASREFVQHKHDEAWDMDVFCGP